MYQPIGVNPTTRSAQTSDPQASGTSSSTGIDGVFMQLLVTQLQNQDPLSPMDPSSFVNQLVGVNTLDQISQINQLLQTSLGVTTGYAPSTPSSSNGAGGQ